MFDGNSSGNLILLLLFVGYKYCWRRGKMVEGSFFLVFFFGELIVGLWDIGRLVIRVLLVFLV